MSSTLRILYINSVHLKVDCDEDIARELNDHFSFYVPGYQHIKRKERYKFSKWDGRIKLFHLGSHFIYTGLLNRIIEFAQERDYKYEIYGFPNENDISKDDALEFINSLNIPPNYIIRNYQLNALVHCVNNKRALIVSPMASGKSKIIYEVFRHIGKTLLVVPNVTLIHQMAGDFRDYGYQEAIGKIYSNQSHDTDKDITISTWQSIWKHPPEWFLPFRCVIVDECHHAKAKCLIELMTKTTEIPYKFGFTATLDDTEMNQLVLEGLFGSTYHATSGKELIDAGYWPNLKIKAITLRHPPDHCRALYKAKYQEELDWLVEHGKRNRFIAELALSLSGNTLVLYRYVDKHGIPLHKMIEDLNDDRPLYLIHGKIVAEDRNQIREIVDREKNSIIVASQGCFSEGINIPNINNIILASPSKSRILVMQAIGRGLRKTDIKTICNVYDIGDSLIHKRKKNYTMKHLMQRLEYYIGENFPYEIHEFQL